MVASLSIIWLDILLNFGQIKQEYALNLHLIHFLRGYELKTNNVMHIFINLIQLFDKSTFSYERLATLLFLPTRTRRPNLFRSYCQFHLI